jgi:ABC-type transport system involved in cytochrome c biogenesis permease subunit
MDSITLKNILLLRIEIGLSWIVTLMYGTCFTFNMKHLIFSKESIVRGLLLGLKITVTLHILLVIFRAFEVQRLPIQTIYEAISWFVVSTVIVYIFIHEKLLNIYVPGVMISGIAFSASIYSLLTRDPYIFTTFAKFNSQWFELHTISAFFAYSLFAVGFSIEIYDVVSRMLRKGDRLTPYKMYRSGELAYKLTASAFAFLTFAIFIGMIWANDIWGVYWIWDAKLTWSLIVWIIYAIYLHCRVIPWLRGIPSSLINIAGFICLVFSFLGIEWFTMALGTLQKCHMSL